jgi:hypothetical protein
LDDVIGPRGAARRRTETVWSPILAPLSLSVKSMFAERIYNRHVLKLILLPKTKRITSCTENVHQPKYKCDFYGAQESIPLAYVAWWAPTVALYMSYRRPPRHLKGTAKRDRSG